MECYKKAQTAGMKLFSAMIAEVKKQAIMEALAMTMTCLVDLSNRCTKSCLPCTCTVLCLVAIDSSTGMCNTARESEATSSSKNKQHKYAYTLLESSASRQAQ